MATKNVLLAGASKARPFTVLIIANPTLEAPRGSYQFVADPIRTMQAAFDAAAQYVVDSLLCRLPSQRESLFTAAMAAALRVVTVFDSTLAVGDGTSLVAQDSDSLQLIGRSQVLNAFVSGCGEFPDVVFAVSASVTHTRSTTWFTQDDDTRPGVSFVYDGVNRTHRFWNLVPGMVSLHVTADALTALHEFQHAISSYTNGSIVDLYVDGATAFNRKNGRPIPSDFCTYNGVTIAADPNRDGLGYPVAWTSYHPAQHNPALPSVMDNYYLGAPPNACENDLVTRQFVIDRITAKMSR